MDDIFALLSTRKSHDDGNVSELMFSECSFNTTNVFKKQLFSHSLLKGHLYLEGTD